MSTNILIIDNQKMQFEDIFDYLVEPGDAPEYVCFPKKTPLSEKERDEQRSKGVIDYDIFTDWVRIFLNKARYNERAEEMRKKLENYILSNQIHLMIIDYKLGGNHQCQTGVELAAEFQKLGENGENFPVIFLSRTPENFSQRLRTKLAPIAKYKWTEKGFASVGLMDETYFNKYVKTNIAILLGKQSESWAIMRLQELLEKDLLDKYFDFFKWLRDLPVHTGEQKSLINKLDPKTILAFGNSKITSLIENDIVWKNFISQQ